ncbi:hypothetical protein F0562_021763 [Nyssa sinensis]|uniref:GATA-type domain-containing protein n=1 Tax=Nyssa sinensis TaxID=561372 RepID=A0A5J5BPK6_9ASTE|nr:hypothetical protein F0562_021763 [Nyssa sinensis]
MPHSCSCTRLDFWGYNLPKFQKVSMVGSGFFGGIDNGISRDGSFDNLLSFLDLPIESLEGSSLYEGDWDANMECLGPIPWDNDLQGCLLSGKICHGTSDVLPILPVPSDKISQPKQPPNFVEETSGASVTLQKDSSDGLQSDVFQARSPVSVLESSISYPVQKSMLISPETVIPVRTRSKRKRSTFNPWHEKFNPFKRITKKKKKKLSQLSGATKMKEISSPSRLSGAMAMKENWLQPHVRMKKCTHCAVTKTPQWREGPMGPKTLCNACGVRFRAGRLFPEYRPAASPTFVPSLHSNSHKKVIEMRNRANKETAMDEMDPALLLPPEFVPDEYLVL